MVGAQSGMPCGEPGMPMVSRPVRNGCSPEDERRAAGRAALLRVGVGEERAFLRDAVDVRRLVAHDAEVVGADVVDADVVAPDDEDVGLLGRGGLRWAGAASALAEPLRLAGACAWAGATQLSRNAPRSAVARKPKASCLRCSWSGPLRVAVMQRDSRSSLPSERARLLRARGGQGTIRRAGLVVASASLASVRPRRFSADWMSRTSSKSCSTHVTKPSSPCRADSADWL